MDRCDHKIARNRCIICTDDPLCDHNVRKSECVKGCAEVKFTAIDYVILLLFIALCLGITFSVFDGINHYFSCCRLFIVTICSIILYCLFELHRRLDKYGDEEFDRNDPWLSFVRLVLLIIIIYALPPTADCDGDHKRPSLIALISLASLFAIFEGLHIIFRIFRRFISWVYRKPTLKNDVTVVVSQGR
jgi:hypothetical protein